MSIQTDAIRTLKGREIVRFRLTNRSGAYVELINYGATIASIVVPDKEDDPGNVVLGFSDLEGYLHDKCYIGATIGRFANRIGNSTFSIDGKEFSLDKNEKRHSLHGGFSGFNSRIFDFDTNGNSVSFFLESKDGEGGYPGNLRFQVVYSWNDQHELGIRYSASSDQKTIANFTNHSYFNLSACRENIFDHELSIRAAKMLEMDRDYIPIGAVIPAGDQSFHRHKIKDRMTREGTKVPGLNNFYVFDKPVYDEPACVLYDERSGRQMEVFTTYPGVQFYTGDFLESSFPGSHSELYKPYDGLCLECQYHPDSPNHPAFPSTIISPGSDYSEQIKFRFSVKR